MAESPEPFSANDFLKQYFLQNEPIFGELSEVRKRGSKNPIGDEHFKNQRENADNAVTTTRWNWYHMMQQIADEMHQQTQALLLPVSSAGNDRVLDLCMAPGGFTASALKYNPQSTIRGISLPREQGGHEMLLFKDRNLQPLCLSQVQCTFLDITMLATEFGTLSILESHPERSSFTPVRPYLGESFYLAFCDGQILRTHARPIHRQTASEPVRLRVSQLILALQWLAPGGTLVMLLHKLEAWDTVRLLHQLSQFAQDLELFKSTRKHADRSSFYVVAKNVRPESEAAEAAVREWKADWWRCTFGGEDGLGEEAVVAPQPDEAIVQRVIDTFGKKLMEMARPVWRIQMEALRKAPYTQNVAADEGTSR